MKTLLKNGYLIDIESGYKKEQLDILIEDEIIVKIEKNITEDVDSEIDLGGLYVSPGFIDMHVHCFPQDTAISMDPDEIGVNRGVTTLVDAGTAGADTMKEFYKNFISKKTTRIYSCLNIASSGLQKLIELRDMSAIDRKKIKECLDEYGEYIVALKARASASVVGENGIAPIALGKAIAKENDLPLVVHIGNAPPRVEEVLELLERGDIVAHCYHDKETSLIRDGKVIEEAKAAYNRGTYFDMAHGSSSFSFEIGKEALELGFTAHVISTDIYQVNEQKPVKSLETTMNKMMYIGMSLEDVITRVTTNPAKIMNLRDLGALRIGAKGDLTIFRLNEGSEELVDSTRTKVSFNNYIESRYVFIKDKLIETWR